MYNKNVLPGLSIYSIPNKTCAFVKCMKKVKEVEQNHVRITHISCVNSMHIEWQILLQTIANKNKIVQGIWCISFKREVIRPFIFNFPLQNLRNAVKISLKLLHFIFNIWHYLEHKCLVVYVSIMRLCALL